MSLAVGLTSTTTVRPSRSKASVGSTTHSSPSNAQPGQSVGLPAASMGAPGYTNCTVVPAWYVAVSVPTTLPLRSMNVTLAGRPLNTG